MQLLWKPVRFLTNIFGGVKDPRNRGPAVGACMLVALVLYLLFGTYRAPSYFVTLNMEDGSSYELAVRVRSPKEYNATVVLLHSEWYDSRIWERLGTLDTLLSHNYRAIALDLPGAGFSGKRKAPVEHFDRAVVLEYALVALNATEAVLVVPSSSGSYALPIVVRGSMKLKGFIAVAPLFVESFSLAEYAEVAIPTLVVYGGDDKIYGPPAVQHLRGIPNTQVRVIGSAGHSCYVDNPDKFHIYLLSFLKSIIV